MINRYLARSILFIFSLLGALHVFCFAASQQSYSRFFEIEGAKKSKFITYVEPRNSDELAQLLRQAANYGTRVCLVGTDKSQGGQTISKGGYRVSLARMNKLLNLDVVNKRVTVQTGMTWRELQTIIAPHKLAVRSMQSYNDFSIGGSLSVNVHGQDVRDSALIQTVESLRLMLADGQIINVSRTENQELFSAVIGGYGLLGIVVDVTLSLTRDCILQKNSCVINAKDLAGYVSTHVKDNPTIEFYSARFSLNSAEFLDKVLVITYQKTELQDEKLLAFEPTMNYFSFARLVAPKLLKLTGKSRILRNMRFDLERFLERPSLISRNNFMGYSLNTLPQDSQASQYILQEYFIPYDTLNLFVATLKKSVTSHNINLLNITARHINRNQECILSIADQECCALVLYINQACDEPHYAVTAEWTKEIIDAALSCGGTYYLPYQLLATQEQFERAYPRHKEFIELKKQWDPESRFTNRLYEQYFGA